MSKGVKIVNKYNKIGLLENIDNDIYYDNGKYLVKLLEFFVNILDTDEIKLNNRLCATINNAIIALLFPKLSSIEYFFIFERFQYYISIIEYDAWYNFMLKKINEYKILYKSNYIIELVNYLIKNKDNLLNLFFGYQIIINKYFSKNSIEYIINDNKQNEKSKDYIKKVRIDNQIFKIYKEYDNIKVIKRSIFSQYFCPYYKENLYLIPESNNKIEHFYILNNNYIFKIICDESKIDSTSSLKFKISDMYFNNNQVISYKNIIFPFKYTIPSNNAFIIYKSNDLYKITYFIKEIEKKESIGFDFIENFSENEVKDQIITLSINPNTNFFILLEPINNNLKIEPDKSINIYEKYFVNYNELKLILDFTGCNKFNIIYKKSYDDIRSNFGYYLTFFEYNLYNYDKNSYITINSSDNEEKNNFLKLYVDEKKYIQTCKIENYNLYKGI